jgi:hypothetical protein
VLHWAAILSLHTICDWLLNERYRKFEVDKMSTIGTPLFCAIMGKDVFSKVYQQSTQPDTLEGPNSTRNLTIECLLRAGASVNDVQVSPWLKSVSPLEIAIAIDHGWEALLAGGAKLGGGALGLTEALVSPQPAYAGRIFQAIEEQNLTEETRPR